MTPRYTEFVNSRVKWFDSHAMNLHHATTGIVGEVLEFEDASTPEHRAEELGDWGFYMEHLRLALIKVAGVADGSFDLGRNSDLSRNFPITALLHNGRCIAGEMLDLTKKLWIYGKEADEAVVVDLLARLRFVYNTWQQTCFLCGLSPIDVLAANQTKLEKRYPAGYTDAAAQARADKHQGES